MTFTLARYTALCQEAALVPIVEPEVLMEGNHDLQVSFDVTKEVLITVFNQLYLHRVLLQRLILKPSMIIAGLQCPDPATINEVADATVKCLIESVPAAVAGIAFLSGGQSGELATTHLKCHACKIQIKTSLAFDVFIRACAIQQPALEIWDGRDVHIVAAQQALYHRAKCDTAARRGEYNFSMENV